MKPKIFALGMVIFVLSACNAPMTATPAQFETPVVAPTSTTSTGGVVTQDNVSFTLPLGVASGAQAEKVAAVTDANNAPSWDVAPEHLEIYPHRLSGLRIS